MKQRVGTDYYPSPFKYSGNNGQIMTRFFEHKNIRSLLVLIITISIFFVTACSTSSVNEPEQTTESQTQTAGDASKTDAAKEEEPTTEEIVKNGWIQENGKNVYYIEGEPAEGFNNLDQGMFYLDKGVAKTGWFRVDGERHYAFDTGVLASGATKVEDRYYIFDEMGRPVEESFLQDSLGEVPVNNSTAPGNYAGNSDGNNYESLSIQGLGGYEPTAEEKQLLQSCIDEIEPTYTLGFMMINLYTGEGVCYNPDADYYSASAIKGPYIASLVAAKPELIDSMGGTLSGIVMYSENERYSALRRSQGGVCLSDWYAASGIDSSAFTNYNYPRVSARILAKLWIHNYYFFNTDETGMSIRTWYEDPINSAIDFSSIGLTCKTESKAGWICEGHYIASNDAGIIYPMHSAPYLISVCSDIPANLEMLEPLCEALAKVYWNNVED